MANKNIVQKLKDISTKDLIIKSIYYKRILGNRGTYILEEDWDNLIILDACRYDMFKEHNTIPGKLEYRYSRGGCTNEFLKENFYEDRYPELIYVSSNPLVDYHMSGKFNDIVSVWDTDWNEEFGTVMPEAMEKRTIEAKERHPNKRIVSHFVQPHYPFIGEWARKNIGTHDGIMSKYLFDNDKGSDHTDQLVWNLLERGEIDKEVLWKGYVENLKEVLPYAEELVNTLNGRSVITSDHGNLFAEWLWPFPVKEYGHPCKVYKKSLVKVPWLII